MSGPRPDPEIDSINEFYRRWPHLREHPVALLDQPGLTADQRMILGWMILVIDRVGPADLPCDAKVAAKPVPRRHGA